MSLARRGFENVVSAILLTVVAVVAAAVLYMWLTSWFNNVLKNVDSSKYSGYVSIDEVHASITSSRQMRLTIYVSPIGGKALIKTVVVKEISQNGATCRVDVGKVVVKPYTKIDVNCVFDKSIASSNFKVIVYTPYAKVVKYIHLNS